MANEVQTGTARSAFDVTPSDTKIIFARALYIGTGGDVAVTMEGGQSVTFKNVLAGTILPVIVQKVAEATTADDIVGLTY